MKKDRKTNERTKERKKETEKQWRQKETQKERQNGTKRKQGMQIIDRNTDRKKHKRQIERRNE